jgi:glycosyltransferase involved in cell wall biosynthesis
MKLVLLTPEYRSLGGGVATFYRSLVPGLTKAGMSVRVVEGSAFATTSPRQFGTEEGVQVESLELGRFRRWHDRFERFNALPTVRRHLAAAWAMWEQACEGDDPDIVEACDWGLSFVPPLVEASHPLVVQCHGSIGQIGWHDPIEGGEAETITTQLLERASLSAAFSVQTCSSANMSYWQQETGHHIEKILPAFSRKDRGGGTIHQRGLVVGRLQRWKGPATLCRALELLGSRAPAVDWIGRDTSWGENGRSSSTYLASTFPRVWNDRLRHLPQRPPAEVTTAQASALFNIVPSTWDVFNFTAAEAMSSGRPTIVSQGAGASELIEDGVNGFTFAADDAEGLAGVIDRVLSASPERLAEIGASGRATVAERLDPQGIAEQRIAAYKTTIAKFASSPKHQVGGTLGSICRPDDGLAGDKMSFLEHHSLRGIIGHVAGRIARKARNVLGVDA